MSLHNRFSKPRMESRAEILMANESTGTVSISSARMCRTLAALGKAGVVVGSGGGLLGGSRVVQVLMGNAIVSSENVVTRQDAAEMLTVVVDEEQQEVLRTSVVTVVVRKEPRGLAWVVTDLSRRATRLPMHRRQVPLDQQLSKERAPVSPVARRDIGRENAQRTRGAASKVGRAHLRGKQMDQDRVAVQVKETTRAHCGK
jgi:hypothetical protein